MSREVEDGMGFAGLVGDDEYANGWKAAIKAAVKVCQAAINSYDMGAGCGHSVEARDVGRAQAEWCRDEIKRLRG